MKILVSACLLGTPCRYDGASKPRCQVQALADRGHTLIPVCPESDGGLPTPRPPAERQADGRVVNKLGTDVTLQYRSGARIALDTALREGCRLAILKERSPSCGRGEIYDGSFTGTLIPGDGVTAELLNQYHIPVIGESAVEAYFTALEENT